MVVINHVIKVMYKMVFVTLAWWRWTHFLDIAKTEMLTFCLKNCVKVDQTKDTSWSENAESVQLFICMLLLVVLSIFIQKKQPFVPSFSSLECSRVWSLFTSEEQRKVVL